jgi:hypothetical protein
MQIDSLMSEHLLKERVGVAILRQPDPDILLGPDHLDAGWDTPRTSQT